MAISFLKSEQLWLPAQGSAHSWAGQHPFMERKRAHGAPILFDGLELVVPSPQLAEDGAPQGPNFP